MKSLRGGAGAKLRPLLAQFLLHFVQIAEARARQVGAHHFDGIAQIIHVAERVSAAAVSHELEQINRQRACDLQRHGKILVLLLAEPRPRTSSVHFDTWEAMEQ